MEKSCEKEPRNFGKSTWRPVIRQCLFRLFSLIGKEVEVRFGYELGQSFLESGLRDLGDETRFGIVEVLFAFSGNGSRGSRAISYSFEAKFTRN